VLATDGEGRLLPAAVKEEPETERWTPPAHPTPRTRPRPGQSVAPLPGMMDRGIAAPGQGLKTSTSQRKKRVEPDTPASTRKRVKMTLIRIAEEAETREVRKRGRRARERRRCSMALPPWCDTPATSARRGAPRKRVKTLIQIAEEAETRAVRRRGRRARERWRRARRRGGYRGRSRRPGAEWSPSWAAGRWRVPPTALRSSSPAMASQSTLCP